MISTRSSASRVISIFVTITFWTVGLGSSSELADPTSVSNKEIVMAEEVKEMQGSDNRELQEYIERRLDSLRSFDICKNGDSYGKCDKDKLRERMNDCGKETCFFRIPMSRNKGKGYKGNRKDPMYYIDYDEVYCTNPNTSCDRCWKGAWCKGPQRCIHESVRRKYRRRGKLKQICPGGFMKIESTSRRNLL